MSTPRLTMSDIEAADAMRAEVDERAGSLAIARCSAGRHDPIDASLMAPEIVLSDPPSALAWRVTDGLMVAIFALFCAFWVSADLRAWGTALARSLFQ